VSNCTTAGQIHFRARPVACNQPLLLLQVLMVTGQMTGRPASRGKGGGAVEREEFAEFYAASFQRLVGQLYAMTGDQCEAQDAVQEAFVRAWARRGKIDRDGAPEAWVRVTAWRIAASRWRRARTGTRLGALTARPESTAGPTPDRVAFNDALRKVPAEQRRALVLYHLCDMTVDQVAAETGARAGTVKARLARGRAALAPYLRETAAPVTE
jgi:RNA polymerase sigma-70 factor, ECF subfamily